MPTNVPTRSPIKHKPLRQAGSSGQWRLIERAYNVVGLWCMLVAAAWVLMVQAWGVRLGLPNTPWLVTVAVVVLTAVGWWQVQRAYKELKPLKQGVRGEQHVGQLLDQHMPALGYRVFHDLPGDETDTWNIDHVVIGPGGIFAVETKTISKPAKGKVNVVCKGDVVTIDGHTPDRDPVQQAVGAANRIRAILERETGWLHLPVKPVVLFPGWFIQGSCKSAWVLEPKAFVKWVANEPEQLEGDKVAKLAARLEEYVRRVD